MKTYPLEVCVKVNINAPSLEDAKEVAEDIFGNGELEDFDIEVASFTVKEV
jgi:hypothetical protein